MIQEIRREIPEIDQAAQEYERFIAHHTLQYSIQRQEIAERDYISEMKSARNRGLAEGKAEGLTQGLAEGLTQGKAEIARKLKAEGFDNTKIAQLTDLSIEEIEGL